MHPNMGAGLLLLPPKTFLSPPAPSNEEPVSDKVVARTEACQGESFPARKGGKKDVFMD